MKDLKKQRAEMYRHYRRLSDMSAKWIFEIVCDVQKQLIAKVQS